MLTTFFEHLLYAGNAPNALVALTKSGNYDNTTIMSNF